MFYIEVRDYEGHTTNGYVTSCLEIAIESVKDEILNGNAAENIRVYKEIPFTFELNVTIPQE